MNMGLAFLGKLKYIHLSQKCLSPGPLMSKNQKDTLSPGNDEITAELIQVIGRTIPF